MRNKENKIISKEKNIKNNSLNNKKTTIDKNEENKQISNAIEGGSEKHNIKNKRIFNDTHIEIKGDYTRENKAKKNKIIPIYNFCYDEDNLLTRFIFKNSSRNYEYYYCYKSGKGCKGKGKYDIKTKEFKVYVKCDKNINHEKNTFPNFEMKINNNKFDDIDMNLKCNQRYYVRYLFKHKLAEDKNTIVEKLKELLGKNNIIKLTDNDINYEKSRVSKKINDENILSLIENLKSEIKDLIIKKQDIIYEIQTKNNEDKSQRLTKKEEEVIYFGNANMFDNLYNPNIKQYFLDFTYKIIPNKFKPYRLMTLKGFDFASNSTKLCCLIAIKYEDEKSIFYTLKYLNEYFKFSPKVINIDYSLALYKALRNKNLFNNDCIIIRCFFHFSQALIRKMKQLKIIQKRLSKEGFEILLNIQIICFLKEDLIDDYLNFLKKNSKEEKLYNYIENYWIKLLGWQSINYYKFIKMIKEEKGLYYLFITNNIIESFHSKLVKYLPRGPITAKGFINAMTNVLKDNVLQKNSIKRHDYKTKTILCFAEKYNESNIKFKWYNYKEFYEAEQKVYNNSHQNINTNIFEKELNDINGIEDELSLESNEIKIPDNNINNEFKEEEYNISFDNETLIHNDLIEPINEEKCDNIDGESFIENLDKIFTEESINYKDFPELLDFKISTEQSNKNVNKQSVDKSKEKNRIELKKKKRCYNEVTKDKNEEKNKYPANLEKKEFKAY